MDVRHLEHFSEVAKQLSFTKAASALHISQPSLSKSIKNLEEELGVPLFYRSSKQLELTDAGKAVLINARNVLKEFKNLTSKLADIMELKRGEIRIGLPPIVGAAFFSTFISQYKEAFPLIEIHLTEVGSKKIKQGVEEGELDIGLICNLPHLEDCFEVKRLLVDPLMLIVHREHVLAQEKSIQFADIKKESFILYRKDFTIHDRIIEQCSKNGFYPKVVCESSQKDFMIEMVQAKLGVALLPSKICQDIRHPKIVALPFIEPVHLELGMIWKKDKYIPFSVREFISMFNRLPLN